MRGPETHRPDSPPIHFRGEAAKKTSEPIGTEEIPETMSPSGAPDSPWCGSADRHLRERIDVNHFASQSTPRNGRTLFSSVNQPTLQNSNNNFYRTVKNQSTSTTNVSRMKRTTPNTMCDAETKRDEAGTSAKTGASVNGESIAIEVRDNGDVNAISKAFVATKGESQNAKPTTKRNAIRTRTQSDCAHVPGRTTSDETDGEVGANDERGRTAKQTTTRTNTDNNKLGAATAKWLQTPGPHRDTIRGGVDRATTAINYNADVGDNVPAVNTESADRPNEADDDELRVTALSLSRHYTRRQPTYYVAYPVTAKPKTGADETAETGEL
ncbi:MAG: hypothetical protein FD157_4171, partial [Rhodocyclaceae bacterium]